MNKKENDVLEKKSKESSKNIPKKLDINRILIVPVYRRKSSNTSFSSINGIDYVDTKSIHSYDNRWTAVYIKDKELLFGVERRYFNLLDNFKEIKDGTKACSDEFIINANMSIPLINYINTSKYLYNDTNIIDRDELLYLIHPIALRVKYTSEKEHNIVSYDDNNCTIEDVYFKNSDECRIIKRKVEKHKYFAIDVLTGAPISYDYFCVGIPYIPKNIIKNNSIITNNNNNKNKNKSLLKRLLKR